MSDLEKTKEQLIKELNRLRQRVDELEALETQRKQAEETLRESEDRFQRMAGSVQDGITIIEHGEVIFANDRACEIFGYPREEYVLKTDFDFAAPEEKERLAQIAAEIQQTDVYPDQLEFWILRKDGTRCCVRNRYSVSFTSDGTVSRYVVTTDITERKQARHLIQESEERYRTLVETSPDGIGLLDLNGNIIMANQEFVRQCGYDTADELIGRNAFEFVEPAEQGGVAGRFSQIHETGRIKRSEYRLVRKDGVAHYAEGSASLIRDAHNNPTAIITVVRDITERKQFEKEIKKRNRQLAALNEISQAVTSSLDLNRTLTLVADHTIRLMGVEATSLLLYDDDRGDLWFAAGSGAGVDRLIGQRLAWGQGIAGWVAQHGEPAIVHNVSKDPRWFAEFDESSDFTTRSILCVPLTSKDQIIGALEAMNKQTGPFDAEDLWLLSSMAAPAATAIENARLFEQVRGGRAKLQALSRRLVEAQEAERGHIARELHDETGQALSSLLLGLSLLEREADKPERVVARASEMESLVDEMLENLHRLSMNLRPATLDHLGLTAALDQYVDAFSRQHKVDVQYETIGLDGERLSPEVETTLYRILQEALTNVARHARASRVDVLLKRRDDCVVAVIEDDGVGFDLAAAKQSGRLGLFGMQERAEMLDGCLTIESAVGTGTSVSVEVPCVHPDSNRR